MGYGVQNIVFTVSQGHNCYLKNSIPCLHPNAQSMYLAKISPSRAITKLSFRSKSTHTYHFSSYQLLRQTFTGGRWKINI